MTTSVAAWSGRLILPSARDRRADGGVFFEVLRAPQVSGVSPGDQLPLVWQNSDRLQVSNSLNYSDASYQALQKGNVLAERLLGWQQISPLESLAGARPEDSLLVSLEGATWDGQRLTVTHQPVEIAGPDKALVTVDRVEGKKLLGHYPSGKKVVVQSQPRVERLDLERLQGQPLWIYGTSQSAEEFEATALLPASLLSPRPDQTYSSLAECQRALRKQIWKDTPDRMNQIRTLLLNPVAEPNRFNQPGPFLCLHLFGGYQGPGGDPKLPLDLVGGHFAYGQSQLEDGQLQLEYHQVYGQNPDQIVSATQSQEAYLGSFERGWLFNRPVTDLHIAHPALQRTFQFGGQNQFNFFQTLQEELQRVQARYRVGDGDGVAEITPTTNCSQDSASAMFATVERILQMDQTIVVYPGEEQYKDFQSLVGIARDLRKVLLPWGKPPKAWQDNLERKPGGPRGAGALQALTTWKTVLPRKHQEEVAEVLLRHGAQILVKSSYTVAAAPEVQPPSAPTTF